MEIITYQILEALGELFGRLWSNFLDLLPRIIAALIILIIGFFIGRGLGIISSKLLTRFKVDEYVFRGRKPIISIERVIPVLITWFIYLIFIQAAANQLAVPTIVLWINAIINFIPGVIGAVLIIIAGYAIGNYIREQIVETKMMYANIVGTVIFFLILYISIAVALPLLQIDVTLINNVLLVILGAFGVGIAIALGLGLKDIVAEYAKKYIKEMEKSKK